MKRRGIWITGKDKKEIGHEVHGGDHNMTNAHFQESPVQHPHLEGQRLPFEVCCVPPMLFQCLLGDVWVRVAGR